MIDTLRLTAEDAMGLLERGEVTGSELHRAYSDAIAARDAELHAYLSTVDEDAQRWQEITNASSGRLGL